MVDAVTACKVNLTDGILCGYLCQLTTGTDTCMRLLTGVMDVYFLALQLPWEVTAEVQRAGLLSI